MEQAAPIDDTAVAGLVSRAAGGDAEAFGVLYDAFVARVYRFVYYRVHTVQEAEDLTEEIFMKAWRGLADYRATQVPFAAWLFRIARNHVIDHHRTRHPTEPLQPTDAADDEPEAEALRAVEGQQVRELMATLTGEQRQVLEMRFFEGLSTAEIAVATGRNEGAIRALQMRALASLRRALLRERGAYA